MTSEFGRRTAKKHSQMLLANLQRESARQSCHTFILFVKLVGNYQVKGVRSLNMNDLLVEVIFLQDFIVDLNFKGAGNTAVLFA